LKNNNSSGSSIPTTLILIIVFSILGGLCFIGLMIFAFFGCCAMGLALTSSSQPALAPLWSHSLTLEVLNLMPANLMEPNNTEAVSHIHS
jgi:hypothetical protein